MCFNIHYKHPVVKIAKRDIICYKVIKFSNPHGNKGKDRKIKCYSPYTYFRYILNKLNSVKKFGKGYENINEGFHSYSSKKQALKDMGYHRGLVTCIIPKGTKYYYNPDRKEYCSLKIKMIEVNILSNSITDYTKLSVKEWMRKKRYSFEKALSTKKK